MNKILIPVGRSANALHAVKHAISIARRNPLAQCHLLHVEPPVPLGIHAYMSREEVEVLEAAEAEEVLKPAREMLEAADIPYVAVFRTGQVAPTIVDYAEQSRCDSIVMGIRRRGIIGALISVPTTAKVIRLSRIPVTLVK